MWKNRKPSQLKCGGTKACDFFFFFIFLDWKRNSWASDSAERGQYEAAEKSKDDLRDWNGRWSIANKYVYVHQIEMENAVHSVCWMFAAFGSAEKEDK